MPLKPPTVSDPKALITLIQGFNQTQAVHVVGIDGHPGSGKSWLAGALAELTGWAHIELDRYVIPNQCSYIPSLKPGELRAAIVAARARGIVIVDGMCLRQALAKASVTADVHVYVRRLSQAGHWPDEDLSYTADDGPDGERCLREDWKAALVFNSDPTADEPPPARLEVVRYHRDFRPLAGAAIVYDNKLCD